MTLPDNQSVNPATGDQSQAPAGSNSVPAGQTAVTPGLTLEAIERLLDAKIAPIAAKVERSTNFEAGRQRIARKGGGNAAPETEPAATPNPNAPNIDAIPDEATRAWARQVQRENEARAQREAEQAAQAERDKAANTLEALLREHKPARPEMVRKLMAPYLKVGTDGKVYHDEGGPLRHVDEVFREIIAQEPFKPASVSQGSGTTPGAAPVIGRPNVMAATASIADPIDRLARQLELQAANK